jgi:hypothetical protein
VCFVTVIRRGCAGAPYYRDERLSLSLCVAGFAASAPHWMSKNKPADQTLFNSLCHFQSRSQPRRPFLVRNGTFLWISVCRYSQFSNGVLRSVFVSALKRFCFLWRWGIWHIWLIRIIFCTTNRSSLSGPVACVGINGTASATASYEGHREIQCDFTTASQGRVTLNYVISCIVSWFCWFINSQYGWFSWVCVCSGDSPSILPQPSGILCSRQFISKY